VGLRKCEEELEMANVDYLNLSFIYLEKFVAEERKK
jgi:hypothetical protein